MLCFIHVVLDVYSTWCMLFLMYPVVGICCTHDMLYSWYAVLGVNVYTSPADTTMTNEILCSQVTVEWETQQHEVRGSGGNHLQKQKLSSNLGESQFAYLIRVGQNTHITHRKYSQASDTPHFHSLT